MSPLSAPSGAGAGPADTSAERSFLSLLQLTDSAFPNGRYTLSHGLEALVQEGRLQVPTPPSQLITLLNDIIRLAAAPSDGVAVACAHRALRVNGSVDFALVLAADERLTAVKIARGPREASRRTGRALLDAAVRAFGSAPVLELAQQVDAGRTTANHAVVFGLVSSSLGVPRIDAVAGELYAFAAGWIGAAVRLGLADHLTAQQVLHRALRAVSESARCALDRSAGEISACAPLVETMSMRHEAAEVRLFAT